MVSGASKVILLPFPSPSQLRLWFVVSSRMLIDEDLDVSLAVMSPELFALSFIVRQLQEEALSVEEALFLGMSLVHRVARFVAHLSYFCKVCFSSFARSVRAWRDDGGLGGVARFWWRRRLTVLSELAALAILESLLFLGASSKLLAAEALGRLPFGGRHLVALYWSASMLIALVYASIDVFYLVAVVFAPLGWRVHREFPSAGARPPSLDAMRELSQIERRARLFERACDFFWLGFHNDDDGLHEDDDDDENDEGNDNNRNHQPRERGGGGNLINVNNAAAGFRGRGLLGPKRPGFQWPPKLPSRGPPVLDDENERISAAYPDAICPISHSLLLDPVVTSTGSTYNRSFIEAHLISRGTDPVTNDPCALDDLRPNYALRNLVDDIITRTRATNLPETKQAATQTTITTPQVVITPMSSKTETTTTTLAGENVTAPASPTATTTTPPSPPADSYGLQRVFAAAAAARSLPPRKKRPRDDGDDDAGSVEDEPKETKTPRLKTAPGRPPRRKRDMDDADDAHRLRRSPRRHV